MAHVSLNRCEQLLFDYVEKNPDERQFWMHKVRGVAHLWASPHLVAERLEGDISRYFQERANVVSELKEFVRHQGGQRTSMRNLAEHWLKLWVIPKRAVQNQRPARNDQN